MSGEFKGTPGQWKYRGPLGEIYTEEHGVIADLMVSGYEDENGNLMAAAPELLEALQLAEKAMVDGRNITYPEWYGVINKARSAIAKALGKKE
ncbi:TPA: hypothetical protein ACYU77_002994 [Klebsiella variicola subsp. variicola]